MWNDMLHSKHLDTALSSIQCMLLPPTPPLPDLLMVDKLLRLRAKFVFRDAKLAASPPPPPLCTWLLYESVLPSPPWCAPPPLLGPELYISAALSDATDTTRFSNLPPALKTLVLLLLSAWLALAAWSVCPPLLAPVSFLSLPHSDACIFIMGSRRLKASLKLEKAASLASDSSDSPPKSVALLLENAVLLALPRDGAVLLCKRLLCGLLIELVLWLAPREAASYFEEMVAEGCMLLGCAAEDADRRCEDAIPLSSPKADLCVCVSQFFC
jgi:hypothetical protein